MPDAFSTAGPSALTLYRGLLGAITSLGPFKEEVKKTSIHLVRETAFAGVSPRKEYLRVTIKSGKPLRSRRILKAEQTSKSRWHVEVKIAEAGDIDAELLGWLKAAYEMSG